MIVSINWQVRGLLRWLTIGLCVVGIGWYYGEHGCSVAWEGQTQQMFRLGAELRTDKYDSTQVFEPVDALYGEVHLPAVVSLRHYAPQCRHQGQQASSVGWAVSYAARTILEAHMYGTDPNRLAFSPSFLYNQLAQGKCRAVALRDALRLLQYAGDLPMAEFGYDERTCSIQPDSAQLRLARAYRVETFSRLTRDADQYEPDLLAVKQHIAQGIPVVIGMRVGGSFIYQMRGQALWKPTQSDYHLRDFAGHAMCVIGYDDRRYGGAFLIMNSWGRDWGDEGYTWVRYEDFRFFVEEAYALYPLVAEPQLDVQFGLLDVAAQQLIELERVETNEAYFRPHHSVGAGSKLKVLCTNRVACYVYVLGENRQGEAYVLFPYSAQYNPYLGISGTRLFPRHYSLEIERGNDSTHIAVLLSDEPIDVWRLASLINTAGRWSFRQNIALVLGAAQAAQVHLADERNMIVLRAYPTKTLHVAWAVLEIVRS